jgi:hypothetical protein
MILPRYWRRWAQLYPTAARIIPLALAERAAGHRPLAWDEEQWAAAAQSPAAWTHLQVARELGCAQRAIRAPRGSEMVLPDVLREGAGRSTRAARTVR